MDEAHGASAVAEAPWGEMVSYSPFGPSLSGGTS